MNGAGLFKICNRPSFQFMAFTILYLSPNAMALFNITPIFLNMEHEYLNLKIREKLVWGRKSYDVLQERLGILPLASLTMAKTTRYVR